MRPRYRPLVNDNNFQYADYAFIDIEKWCHNKLEKLVTRPPDSNVTTLYHVLQRGARVSDNGECLGERIGTRKRYGWIRYEELINRAHRIGSALLKLGLKPGEQTRVGICGLNCPEYVVTIYGCISFSIVVVPLFHNYHKDILSHIINECQLSVVFCDNSERLEIFLQNAAETPALEHLVLMRGSLHKDVLTSSLAKKHRIECHSFNDLLIIGDRSLQPMQLPTAQNTYIICHTSGTTGTPKGIVLTHSNMIANLSGFLLHWEKTGVVLGPTDVSISYLPLAHMYEQMLEPLMFYHGAKVGFFGGDVEKLMEDMQVLRPTLVPMVPRLLNKLHDKIRSNIDQSGRCKQWLFNRALLAKEKKLQKGQISNSSFWDKMVFRKIQNIFGGRLRFLITGGAPIAAGILRFSRAVYGCVIFEGYGQSEVTCAATLTMPDETIGGHVGVPLPSCHIKLMSVPEMNYFTERDSGEVCLRGPTVMSGYFNRSDLTSETVDADGWLHTGDIGCWTENGGLQIIDRKKDILKLSNGEYLSPEKIESIYVQSPFVSQIFVDGDSLHSYLIALVFPDFRVLANWALQEGITEFLDPSELCFNQRVLQHVLTEMRVLGAAKGLSSLEQVKKIHLHTTEFSIDNELLTPTMKVRRAQVRRRFIQVIEKLYDQK